MKMNRMISFSVALLALSLTVACGEDKKFGGSVPEATTPKAEEKKPIVSAPTDDAKPDVKSDPITPIDKSVAPTECDPGSVGLTSVKLLSTGILVETDSQTLRYELSVVSCKDGTVLPIKDQAISFDLNAQAINGFRNIAYRVLDASNNNLIGSGDLKVIPGSDLFGNSGEYAHWETTNLTYSTAVEKLIMEIDLDGTSFRATDTKATEIASYLKVGDAQAVPQDLKITNKQNND